MKKQNSVIKLVLKYKFWMLIALIFTFFETLTTYFFPKYIQTIIDIVIPTKDYYRLKELISFIIFLEVVSLTSTLIINYIFAHISNQFVLDLKTKIIETAFSFNRKEIENNSKQIITIMNSDVYYIQSIISKVLPKLLIDIFTLIAIFVLLYSIEPIILLIALIFYPILLFIQYFFNKKISKQSKICMNSIDKSNHLLQEFVKYLFDYICLGAKEYFVKRYLKQENDVKDSKLQLDLLNNYNNIVPSGINSFALILMVLICSYSIMAGSMSIGGITIFIMYINQLFNPVLRIMLTMGEYQRIKVSMQRINSILDQEGYNENKQN